MLINTLDRSHLVQDLHTNTYAAQEISYSIRPVAEQGQKSKVIHNEVKISLGQIKNGKI